MCEGAFGFQSVNAAVTASQSNVTLVASPGIGKRIVINDLLFSSLTSTGDSELTIKSGANVIIGPLKVGATSQITEISKQHFCNPNEALVYSWNQSSTGGLNMNINYHIRG